ncbi:MAG: hypothetical protein B6D39_12485 [Anaerolineae bacterium UTCFX2]|jgi:uncharacterized membrane protein YhfC|nr:MAG: hypothetical protein B6D39_12485 [Anaerolineae bacterium UTCFX2]
MKIPSRLLIVLAFGLTAVLLLSGSAAAQQPDREPEQLARQFIDLLVQGRFEDAAANYDEAMLKALPPARLRSTWQDVISQYGAFQEIVEVKAAPADGYTAVNVQTRFEKALINIRVVYDQDQRVAGLFYTPIEPIGKVSPDFLITLAVSAFFVIVYPLVLAFLVWRRYSVSWLYFVYGVGIFTLFQLVLRIPMVVLVQALLGAQIRSSTWLSAVWLILLAFSAGLFEEFGRYVGYRWIMPKDPKTWKVGVMYGIGHGGIEAMMLVGLSQVTLLAILTFSPLIAGYLPAELRGALTQPSASLVGSPAWVPLLAAWERFWTVLFHVAMSLVVLQVFRRRQLGWLFLAIGLHTIVNVVVVAVPSWLLIPKQTSQLLAEALVGVIGLFSVWAIWRFKRAEEKAATAG